MKTITIAISVMLGLIVSALIIAKPWVTIRHAKPIAVKGYAEMDVVADSGSLSANVTVTDPTNSDAYSRAGILLERVKEIASKTLGTNMEMIELGTSVSEVAKLDENGKKTNLVDFYSVVRNLRINSADVQGLKTLGRLLYDLNAEGVRISINGPEFFVSDLDSIKLHLVKMATQNGRERAALMAESSGEALGSLVSARQGVIQITKKNSSDTTDWGIYDTETIEKVVKLVVTLEYEVAQ